MPAAAFLPAEHIRRRRDFTRVYDAGVKMHGRLMTMFVHPAPEGCARLGIAATRKLGGAVIRNRVKRLTREVFRHHKPVSHVDVVVIPRREMLASPYVTVEREFTTLVERGLRTLLRTASAPATNRRRGVEPGGSGPARVRPERVRPHAAQSASQRRGDGRPRRDPSV